MRAELFLETEISPSRVETMSHAAANCLPLAPQYLGCKTLIFTSWLNFYLQRKIKLPRFLRFCGNHLTHQRLGQFLRILWFYEESHTSGKGSVDLWECFEVQGRARLLKLTVTRDCVCLFFIYYASQLYDAQHRGDAHAHWVCTSCLPWKYQIAIKAYRFFFSESVLIL